MGVDSTATNHSHNTAAVRTPRVSLQPVASLAAQQRHHHNPKQPGAYSGALLQHPSRHRQVDCSGALRYPRSRRKRVDCLEAVRRRHNLSKRAVCSAQQRRLSHSSNKPVGCSEAPRLNPQRPPDCLEAQQLNPSSSSKQEACSEALQLNPSSSKQEVCSVCQDRQQRQEAACSASPRLSQPEVSCKQLHVYFNHDPD